MSSLDERVAIVTGAANGIGRACAEGLARAGAHVIAVDVDAAGAEASAAAVSALGRKGLAVTADVGDLAAIDALTRRAMDAFGRIDVLVNNAGVTRRAPIMDLTEADWDRIFRVNAKGVFFCLQRVAREMIPRRSGAIVNIASIAGKGYAGTSNAIYAASKGAVISLTRIAALQLAQHDIRVNSVCPATILTPIQAKFGLPPDVAQAVAAQYTARIPLGRFGAAEEVARAALFLASPASSYVTGIELLVDGGLAAT